MKITVSYTTKDFVYVALSCATLLCDICVYCAPLSLYSPVSIRSSLCLADRAVDRRSIVDIRNNVALVRDTTRAHHVYTIRMTRELRSSARQVSHPPCATPLASMTSAADEDDVPRPEFRSHQPAVDWRRRSWWSSRKWGVAISWSVCPVVLDPRSAWKYN